MMQCQQLQILRHWLNDSNHEVFGGWCDAFNEFNAKLIRMAVRSVERLNRHNQNVHCSWMNRLAKVIPASNRNDSIINEFSQVFHIFVIQLCLIQSFKHGN